MFLNRTQGIMMGLAVLLTLSSCQPRVLKGLMEENDHQLIQINGLLRFNEQQQAHYRAKIEAFDQKISGPMIIKKQESSYRVVMITDFGLKVIDMILFENGDYQVKYIMKHMDYEFIKQSFALNLWMLLPNSHSNDFVYYSKNDQGFIQYPPQNIIYYEKEAIIHKVERYRGKKKVWATAILEKNDRIEIHQTSPAIYISLKPIN